MWKEHAKSIIQELISQLALDEAENIYPSESESAATMFADL